MRDVIKELYRVALLNSIRGVFKYDASITGCSRYDSGIAISVKIEQRETDYYTHPGKFTAGLYFDGSEADWWGNTVDTLGIAKKLNGV